MKKICLPVILLSLAVGVHQAAGVALVTEDFSADPGWTDRDPGEMLVTYNAGFGNAAGSLQGTFGPQGAPLPEVDAFRIDSGASGGAFTGDYYSLYPSFSSWAFQFYADDVLPSALLIRFGDGTNTFQRALTSLVTGLDTWTSISVSLDYAGWAGGTSTDFSNTLTSVSFIDLQVSRAGTGAQDYFVDNFTLNDNIGGGSAVPEPGTISLLAAGAALLGMGRRRFQKMAREKTLSLTALTALSCLGLLAAPAHAQSYTMEPFAADLSSWSKGDIGGSLIYSNESATMTFAEQEFIAVERARFVADFNASGGVFAGDYQTRDLVLLGFDFFCDPVLPAGETIQVYMYSTGGVAFVKAVGIDAGASVSPQRVVLSLESVSAGGWLGGTEEQFQSCLGNVTSLQVRVTRNGIQAQSYSMDNVFVAGRPQVVGYDNQTGGSDSLTIYTEDAIPGTGYEIVGTTNLNGSAWETVTSLVSTSDWETIVVNPPTNAATFFYRLKINVE